MSVRDEGKTHFFGDDCPGGHRAAGVAGVDWDDQETADEANAREAAERDSAALVPVDVTDEMVDAYVRAIFTGWYIEMKGEELRQDVRAGLAAVVPLIRAQVADDAQRHYEEIVAEAWDAVATLLAGGAKESRRQGLSEQYAEGWTDAAATIAETVAEMRARHAGAEPVADVHAAFDGGEKVVTKRPVSNREFIAAEVERLGLQPKVNAMWAEIENGPLMPAGWCTWHQMVDCAGDAPECREARAELPADPPVLNPLPPASNEVREHPGTGRPSEGVPMAADGVERTYDLGGQERTP